MIKFYQDELELLNLERNNRNLIVFSNNENTKKDILLAYTHGFNFYDYSVISWDHLIEMLTNEIYNRHERVIILHSELRNINEQDRKDYIETIKFAEMELEKKGGNKIEFWFDENDKSLI
jgi:hypothetical protein